MNRSRALKFLSHLKLTRKSHFLSCHIVIPDPFVETDFANPGVDITLKSPPQ